MEKNGEIVSHSHPCTTEERGKMNAVVAEFPLMGGGLQACQAMTLGSTGQAYRVETSAGAFLVKEVGKGFSLPSLEFAFLMQEKLHQLAFPCSRPLRTDAGKWVSADGLFTAQTFLAGTHLDPADTDGPDAVLAARLGALVGRLHGALKDADLPRAPDNRRQKRKSAIAQTEEGTAEFFRGSWLRPSLYSRRRLRFPRSEMDRDILRALPLLRQAVEHLVFWAAGQGEKLGKLFPTHGDLNWENILSDGNGSLFLVDFDNAIMQPRLFELGGAAAILTPQEGPARDAFLDAYAAEGWERPDEDVIRHLALLKYARSLNWQIAQWFERRGQNEERQGWIRFLLRGLESHWPLVRP